MWSLHKDGRMACRRGREWWPVAVGSVEGNEAEKRRITGLSTADIVDRAVGEEIDRMPFEHFLLVILDHQVATEADRMAMWEGYPVIIVCRGCQGWPR